MIEFQSSFTMITRTAVIAFWRLSKLIRGEIPKVAQSERLDSSQETGSPVNGSNLI